MGNPPGTGAIPIIPGPPNSSRAWTWEVRIPRDLTNRHVELLGGPCRFYKLILLRLGLESIKVVIQFPLDTRVRIDRQHPFVARTSQSSDSTQ